MNRGMFGSLLNEKAYTEAEKDWIVELDQSHMYWLDLVADPHPEIDTKKIVVDYLKGLKKAVEDNLEKRFVYFICSRPRVRFNTRKKASYNRDGELELSLLIGKDELDLTIGLTKHDPNTGNVDTPKFELSEKFITHFDSQGNKYTTSVHDFLCFGGLNLGISTKVQYVGYTENPDTRPTNLEHTGLSKILYKMLNEGNDIFIYFNTFKVYSKAVSSSMINFIVPNSMTDEIEVEREGLIMEKCFILYFDSNNQTSNTKSERGELKNNLKKLSLENKINSIQFYYEYGQPSEYWKFGSSVIEANQSHIFTIELEGDSPIVKYESKEFSEVGMPDE